MHSLLPNLLLFKIVFAKKKCNPEFVLPGKGSGITCSCLVLVRNAKKNILQRWHGREKATGMENFKKALFWDTLNLGYFNQISIQYLLYHFFPTNTELLQVEVTYFPFDDQTCNLKLSSWMYDGSKVRIGIVGDDLLLASLP